MGNGADHEESATRALRAIGLRFPARRLIGSCGPAVDEMIRQIQALRGLVKRYSYVTSFRYDLREPVGKSGEGFDDFTDDLASGDSMVR